MRVSIDATARAAALNLLREAGDQGVERAALARAVADLTGSPGGDHLGDQADLDLDLLIAEWEEAAVVVSRRRRYFAPEALGWLQGVVERQGKQTVVRIRWPSAEGVGDPRAAGSFRDFVLSERDRKGARHGDRVLIRPQRRGRQADHGRAPSRGEAPERRPGRGRSRYGGRGGDRGGARPESAVVERILDRARTTMVGWLVRGNEGEWRLWSFDPKLAADARDLVLVDLPRRARDGELAVVELDENPQGFAGARVSELLGLSFEPSADVRAIMRHHGIAEDFSPEVANEGRTIERGPETVEDAARRLDLRGQLTVTIDGADAKDFDDAIAVDRLRGGGFKVWVHIADVAHYVRPGSAIDREAYRRGTSVYFPDRAVPMLPPRLSEDLCSLRPGEDRLVVTAELEFGADGARRGMRFHLAQIHSRHRLTYERVDAFFRDQDQGATSADLPSDAQSMLLAARALARSLRSRRAQRGALDLDLPSVRLSLDDSGNVVDAAPAPRLEAHRLIEELMLAANEAVAEALESAIEKGKAGKGGSVPPPLYRVHPAPRPEDLETIYELCSGLGIDVVSEGWTERETWDATWLSDLMAKVSGRPDAPVIGQLIVRALQQARYGEACDGHYALATRHYCHFTSPIRRYPDLIVHRSLRAMLGAATPGERSSGSAGVSSPESDRASHLSQRERLAERAERELRKWKLLRYLASRLGSTWQGMVTGVEDFGLFVVLDELLTDGLVTVDGLLDDFYELDRRGHQLVGRRSGKRYRLGDGVRVTIDSVDERSRRLMLAIEAEASRPSPNVKSDPQRRGSETQTPSSKTPSSRAEDRPLRRDRTRRKPTRGPGRRRG